LVHGRYLKVQYRQYLLGHRVLRLRPHQRQRILVVRPARTLTMLKNAAAIELPASKRFVLRNRSALSRLNS
jgi:hypothetical protein